MSSPATNPPSPALPDPPRPLTPAASKAAWRESEVRSLTLIAVGVILVMLVVGVRQVIQGLGDRHLFNNGVLVEATIENIDGANRNVDRNKQNKLRLSFVLPDDATKKKQTIEGFSTPMPGTINQFDKINIRIDPKDFTSWTERETPVPWLHSMIVPLLLTPLTLLLLGMASLRRGAFTSIFTTGKALTGKVTGIERSALVPGQRIVKLVIAGGEGRVLGVTVPASVAPPTVGQAIHILAHDANAGRAIAADAYR